MPGTAGRKTTTGNAFAYDPTLSQRIDDQNSTYTPPGAETITRIGFLTPTANAGTLQIGVYRLDTNALLGSANVVANSVGDNFAVVSISAVPGVPHGVAIRALDGVDIDAENHGVNGYWKRGTLNGGSPLPSTFVEDTEAQIEYAVYADFTSSAATRAPKRAFNPNLIAL